MLNFYNYYGKIHPELMKKLRDIESKLNNSAGGKSNVLILKEKDYGSITREGEIITFTDPFDPNNPISLNNEMAMHILRDIDIIILYTRNERPSPRVFHRGDSIYYTGDTSTIRCTFHLITNVNEQLIILEGLKLKRIDGIPR